MRRTIILPFILLGLAGCQVPMPDEVAVARPPTSMQVASLSHEDVHLDLENRARIVVGAVGQAAAEGWPEFELLVNGRSMGTVAAASPDLTHYVFEADVPADEIKEIRVRYFNDVEIFAQGHRKIGDRNLFVYYLDVDGAKLPAGRRTHIVHEDGSVARGQESLWWNADLVFPIEG
ncbi:carbohydrate-binding domain-containing protein [Indioceanicola profundi]|uniref:carbohydrate-binding domain-containing protein n=1 Tax=Indioceanicola profundi TaxID=2220096 RepID=UPI000E6ADB27|nr:carbohydrate-binding domain-containing protein [Indioceanicola profundi]